MRRYSRQNTGVDTMTEYEKMTIDRLEDEIFFMGRKIYEDINNIKYELFHEFNKMKEIYNNKIKEETNNG